MAEVGKSVEKAVRLLKEGQLIGMPTETVYGLAGNALEEKVVGKIYKVKERPSFDPLIIHFSSPDKSKDYIKAFPPNFKKIYESIGNGPVTYVIQKKSIIPDLTTSGLNTVAVRFPAHPVCRELLGKLDFPVAAPSANPFGYVSPTEARHVDDKLGDRIPYILDGGACQHGIESTILSEHEGIVKILRLGSLSTEKLSQLGIRFELDLNKSSNPKAPGQLQSHYAPGTILYLGKQELPEIPTELKSKKLGFIGFNKFHPEIPKNRQLLLSEKADDTEAASRLFRFLRTIDEWDIEAVIAVQLPESGLGAAINDRLKRAATYSL